MPRQWWPDSESAKAIIESEGPWPSPSPKSNGRFLPLDVDRYKGFAVVVGFGPNRDAKDVLGSDEFERTDAGLWRHLGGGGGSNDLAERRDIREARGALHLRMSGGTGMELFEARTEFEFAVFVCGPDVATVEIRRQLGVRTADVRTGPGWLAVLWTKDDPPEVLAFTGQGAQTFSWMPPSEAA